MAQQNTLRLVARAVALGVIFVLVSCATPAAPPASPIVGSPVPPTSTPTTLATPVSPTPPPTPTEAGLPAGAPGPAGTPTLVPLTPTATLAPPPALTQTTAPPVRRLTTILDERFVDSPRGARDAPGAGPGEATPRRWSNNPKSTAWIADDGFHLFARQPGRHVAVAAPLAWPVGDVVVTALFQKVGGPAGGGYGLIVRDQQPQARNGVDQGGQFYVFEAGDKGEIGVWRRDDNRWIDLVSWTPSDAVRPGKAPNLLTVQAIGSHFTFLVNAIAVATLEDATLGEGGVGLFVGGDGNSVVLSWLTVQTPADESTGAAVTTDLRPTTPAPTPGVALAATPGSASPPPMPTAALPQASLSPSPRSGGEATPSRAPIGPTPPPSALTAGPTAVAGSTAASASATLGSPESSFVQRLGKPTESTPESGASKVDHFGRCPGSETDQFVVRFVGGRATSIIRQTCQGPPPEVTDRIAEALTFAPADVIVGDGFVTRSRDPAVQLTSATLASLLPVTSFQDCEGRAVTLGTLSVALTGTGWALVPGRCP